MKLTRSLTRLLLGVLLALGLAGHAQAESPPSPAPAPFDFALLGDPQIGYGLGGDLADGSRFRQVLEAVDRARPALGIVAGDLVQHRTFWQWWIFERARARSHTKFLLVAGNHDVVSEGSLATFREKYGPDHYRHAEGPVTFIVLDSEVMRSPELSEREFEEQWSWFEKTLGAEPRGRQVFVVAHRPPFAFAENEPGDSHNWPEGTRGRLLSALDRHGVSWFLAGHLHLRRSLVTESGIHVVVEPGSARSFDASPIGYRAFRVEGERVTERIVKVLDAPTPPFVVPGFTGWTPRLFDFSVRHWLFTLAYIATAALALRTARVLRRAKGTATLGVWGVIATALLFFGLNMQLDFDEFLTELGRVGAKAVGIYRVRHLITGSALVFGIVALIWWLARRFRASPGDRTTTAALAALAVPAAWFCLSTISHHDLGMVFSEETWDLLTIAAFFVIGGAAYVAARRIPGGASPIARKASSRAG